MSFILLLLKKKTHTEVSNLLTCPLLCSRDLVPLFCNTQFRASQAITNGYVRASQTRRVDMSELTRLSTIYILKTIVILKFNLSLMSTAFSAIYVLR